MEAHRRIVGIRSRSRRLRFSYSQGSRRIPLRRHDRQGGQGEVQDPRRMEQVDAPRCRHREGTPGLPAAPDGRDRVLPRMPPLRLGRMFLLHRTDQGQTPHEAARGHPGGSEEAQGARSVQHPRGRSDLHRLLRLGGLLLRCPPPRPLQGASAVRRTESSRFRAHQRGQRQSRGHRHLS